MKAKRWIMAMSLLTMSTALSAQSELKANANGGVAYQMNIELKNGETVVYPMSNVQEVIYDNRQTIVNLHGRQTYTSVVYKNADIKAVTWCEQNASQQSPSVSCDVVSPRHHPASMTSSVARDVVSPRHHPVSMTPEENTKD